MRAKKARRIFTLMASSPRFIKGALDYTGAVYIPGVNRGAGTSLQLEATTEVENATLVFEVVEVTDGQDAYVVLNSSGYLTVKPNATSSFYIDVSILK